MMIELFRRMTGRCPFCGRSTAQCTRRVTVTLTRPFSAQPQPLNADGTPVRMTSRMVRYACQGNR